MLLEAGWDTGRMVHHKWRSAGRVDVVERRLGRAVTPRTARVVVMFAVRSAARVAAILRVVAASTVSVRRVSGILGLQ